jgi:hypothetical protein
MNFDLNIENYTRDELINMFELPSNFDNHILEIKETKMRENIMSNKQINKDTQIKTINFLTKAKNIILNTNNNSNSNKLQEKLEDFYNTNYQLKSTALEDSNEHMVQQRDKKPHLTSYPSEFFPGIINPLKKRTLKKVLNIDTRFRDNYYSTTSTNFFVNLPIDINDIIQMQLGSIEIPITFYTISKQYGNNFFNIKINLSDGTSNSTVINIPDGNYDKDSIVQIINTQLSLASFPFSCISFTINLVNGITGSAQTMVGINNTAPVPPNPTITSFELNFQASNTGLEDTGTPLPLKFGWILGFRNGIYVGNVNYVSEGVIDLTGPRYLYLVVDDFNNNVNNYFYTAFNSSILNKNILARISQVANNFRILEQNNLNIVSTPRDYFGPVNLRNLNIQLLDEYGRIVNLNNMDYSFSLILTSIYDL